MYWIKIDRKNNVRKQLPIDGSTFLALWKGQFCLVSFDEDIDHFWLNMQPGVYRADMKVDHEREGKFTHYSILEFPLDY